MAVILKSCVHLSIDPYSHSFAYFSKYLLNLYDVVCMKILLQRKSGRVPHPPMVFCLVLLQSLWTVCSVIPGYPGSVFKIPLRVVLNICFGFAFLLNHPTLEGYGSHLLNSRRTVSGPWHGLFKGLPIEHPVPDCS